MNEIKYSEKLKLIKTRCGYYTFDPKPTPEELQNFYQNKYYQENKGKYFKDYSQEEIAYIKSRYIQFQHVLENWFLQFNETVEGKTFLDTGCGEGFSLAYFHDKGFKIKGVDFSDHGIIRHNPHMLNYFKRDNIFEYLEREFNQGNQYDVVLLDNVLEHVIDPEHLIVRLKTLLKPKGILIIEVPNDFSNTHMELKNQNMISREYWVGYPDHLSYFNYDSLKFLGEDSGLTVFKMIADYPIDFHLFNPDTHFVNDKAKGMGCHLNRIRVENLLTRVSVAKRIQIGEIMAEMGVGRVLTAFFTVT